ncbi:hypothetical protein G6F37_008120 [Rhizopus arrhizus]|nr:hypothetical protein G6F38_001013 [Rhizopus arrhizus]KAG1155889.1 hypothetical protein G6F37_008120 [Rhizopus arrhizus]
MTSKPSNPKKTQAERKAKRDKDPECLINLMKVIDEDAFITTWDEYELWTISNSNEWEIEKEHYSKTELDWHKHLFEVSMQNLQKQRVGTLLYVLWELALPYIIQDHIRTVVGIQQRRLTEAEQKRIDQLMSLNDVEAASLIVKGE